MIALGDKRTGIRVGYGIAAAAAMLLGLGSRHYGALLPVWLANHAGDAIWAAMIYLGCRLLGLGRSYGASALLSLLFCYVIECSQLYQADWINAIRDTTLGGLVLGRGFLVADLLRYTVGVGIVGALDRLVTGTFKSGERRR